MVEQPEFRRKRTGRRWLWISVALLLAALGMFGAWYLTTGIFLLGTPMVVLQEGDQLSAAVENQNRPLVTQLLDAGADINQRALDGRTPLILAAMNGDRPMVELLLARGADVRARGKDGRTALAWALHNRQPEMVEALRRHGAAGGQ